MTSERRVLIFGLAALALIALTIAWLLAFNDATQDGKEGEYKACVTERVHAGHTPANAQRICRGEAPIYG